MKLHRFGYIQHTPFPGKRAHSEYVFQSALASSSTYPTTLIMLQGTINREIPLLSKSFQLIRLPSFPVRLISVMIFTLRSWHLAKKNSLDLIQTNDPEVFVIFHLFRRFYPVKLIFDMHLKPPNWFKNFLKRADCVNVISPFLFQKAVKAGLPTSKLIQLPMGYQPITFNIDQSRKQTRALLNIPNQRSVVSYIGRFETLGKEKGIFHLLDTLARVNDPNLVGLIVGGPPDMLGKYQSYAKKLGIEPRCRFHSQVNPDQVFKYIATSDLAWMVYPNDPHFVYNMSPMKAIEYASLKIPIIASDFPSFRAIFNDSQVFYVDPQNDLQIKKVTLSILQNYSGALIKANHAYRQIKHYTWKNRQNMLINKALQSNE